ncbi:hypothetical protein [Paenibacillus sp. IHBB 3054]|uniref:hypothetical protein n=1 Tax=Paenibacillus sp. IHBB 3054 TaxID=3425689 RepID=UPI003F6628EA
MESESDSSGSQAAETAGKRAFPPEPEKDIVWFNQQYSTVLGDWQRDIMIRPVGTYSNDPTLRLPYSNLHEVYLSNSRFTASYSLPSSHIH